MRQHFSRWLVLSLAALVVGLLVVPTAALVLAPQAAFAQGDQDPSPTAGPEAGTAGAAAAPEVKESVTPSASAAPTEKPTEKPSASAAPTEEPSASATPTEEPSASATPTEEPSASATPTEEPSASATPTEKPSASATPTGASPAPATTASAPTIASDLADYAPGGTVTLTGVGWQAGEVVTIVVNDTGGLSWSLNQQVVADAEGRVTLTFVLPDRYVPDYDVTATGALSGVATTTFTDAATGAYYFWMTQSNPPTTTTLTGGTQVTYSVYGQRRNSPNVTGAVITLTLTGSATFDSSGQPTGVTPSTDGKTATWNPSSLGSGSINVGVKATVTSGAKAGLITATVSGEAIASFNNSDTAFIASLTHSVTGPTVGKCSFATGSGDFSRSICWFDLAGYNPTTAASANGQSMQQTLLNGYVLSYTIKATGTSTNVIAYAPPTYSAAFLGNNGAGYTNNYQGMKGKPALYQQSAGTTVLTLTGISLLDSAGVVVTGFALVGADAESTDGGESITWTSDKVLTSIGPLGNSCGGTLVMASGNTQAKCNAGPVANKTGAAIMYTLDPTVFSQTMVGSGLQAVAFGVMVSGLQLNKQIVHQISGDQFDISVKRPDGTVLGAARTDPTTGYAATDQLYTISSGASQTFTMSEAPVGSASAANYETTWACTRNGVDFTPSGTSANTKTATVSMNDFVMCAITNTGPALTLRKSVDNTAGGALTPANWTLTATKGTALPIVEAPTRSSTTTGQVTTASTATVAVPAGAYILGESSTATGANRYAGNAWSCTKAGGGTSTPTAVLGAGDNVTCTITNTYVPTVTITNTWVNGVSGDKVDLVINNATTSPGKATSTSNGNLGSWTDAFNVARATPAVGSAVSVGEALPATNTGTYTTSAVVCRDGKNAVITVSNGLFTMPNSDVTCDYSNRPTAGTVTWSKVDAGSTSTLLTGSEWTLTGPSYPAPGTTVADCTLSPCVGQDTDPVAGQFSVPVRCGTCTLVEKTAPIGFQLDATPHTFTIAMDGRLVALGAIANKRSPVPALPLTGGASTDAFLLVGYALMAAAGFAGWRNRRRLVRSF